MATASEAEGLTDTDIIVDAARGLIDAVEFLTTQQALAGVHISIISAMELVAGCRNMTELAKLQQFLQQVTILPVSTTASHNAYQLMRSFSLSQGRVVGHGTDDEKLAQRMFEKLGDAPFYIAKVEKKPSVYELPSPEVIA